ncbi:MAG: hypothetical protein GXY20_07950 [Clostridiales bacterium]|nr:hypothetical protein [Clostridiales bacterium]
MSDIMAKDLREQYRKTFSTVRKIVETFPEERWREPHGDIYYIPCRIAYHIALVIDRFIADGYKDRDFQAKVPYGNWAEAKAEALPDRAEFLAYYDGIIARAEKVLADISDEALKAPLPQEISFFAESLIGLHMCMMREISDHTGELNKMLVDNGLEDVWVYK